MKKFAFTSCFMLSLTLAAFCAPVDMPAAANELRVPLINNKYYTESVRYNNIAKLAFSSGDFDTAMQSSGESIRNANLSDAYVAERLKIAAANKKISEAAAKLAWAEKGQAQKYYPAEFKTAQEFYNDALSARRVNEWDSAFSNAQNSMDALANVLSPSETQTVTTSDSNLLPSQYTVRSWDVFGDCFWNIAARPWAYGNPYKWPILYHANKMKLADPNNPDIIEPGLILDIPSIAGEKREGMWDSGRTYSPLKK
ncbi:MAG: LysM peptidoglycan-binding domain-containing protein [Spirochaetaceae bacterium]|jgi:hypothetical protein|nr:LysM peptidoglycan-binding domain-containing protein [Spirochaetaceae bacterium]